MTDAAPGTATGQFNGKRWRLPWTGRAPRARSADTESFGWGGVVSFRAWQATRSGGGSADLVEDAFQLVGAVVMDHQLAATALALRQFHPGRETFGQFTLRSEEHTSELQSPLNLVCR